VGFFCYALQLSGCVEELYVLFCSQLVGWLWQCVPWHVLQDRCLHLDTSASLPSPWRHNRALLLFVLWFVQWVICHTLFVGLLSGSNVVVATKQPYSIFDTGSAVVLLLLLLLLRLLSSVGHSGCSGTTRCFVGCCLIPL
jgi:hypothetical protein